jgi:hypothetical protein
MLDPMEGKLITELTINRSRWARTTVGQRKGFSELLNSDNNMCCLGFACIALGASPEEISDLGQPQLVATNHSLYPLVTPDRRLSGFSENAININDNYRTSDSTKEKMLTVLFATEGIALTFTD